MSNISKYTRVLAIFQYTLRDCPPTLSYPEFIARMLHDNESEADRARLRKIAVLVHINVGQPIAEEDATVEVYKKPLHVGVIRQEFYVSKWSMDATNTTDHSVWNLYAHQVMYRNEWSTRELQRGTFSNKAYRKMPTSKKFMQLHAMAMLHSYRSSISSIMSTIALC